MKPEMTGWLRKFARNPSRSRPIATSRSPGQQRERDGRAKVLGRALGRDLGRRGAAS